MGKYDEIMAKVNAQYKGKYAALGSDPSAFKMERIPTGILAVDAITYGGIPKGRIVIFWGDWSAGKTFTSFKTVARTQRTCKQCLTFMAYEAAEKLIVEIATGEILLSGASAVEAIEKTERLEELTEMKGALADGESLSEEDGRELKSLKAWHAKSPMKGKEVHVNEEKKLLCPRCGCNESLTPVWTAIEDFEPDFARMAGVDCDNLLVIKSEYAEQAIDISADILRSGQCDLMVIDSVAMLTPAKEIEESVTGDSIVTIRDRTGIRPVRMADLCTDWESGVVSHGTQVRGYDCDTATFRWCDLGKVWRLPARKRIFKVRTKYGREIKVTEDHSVFRVLPVNRHCVNRKKHTYRYDAVVEKVRGSDLRIGDYMLLEDSLECGNVETIRLSDELRNSDQAVYAAGVSDKVYSQCRHGRDPKSNWLRGTYGRFVPLSVADDEDSTLSGDEMLYGRGSNITIRNDLPSSVLGWLIGFVAGDGTVFRQDSGSSGIRLYVGRDSSTRRIFRRIADLRKFGNIGICSYPRPDSNMVDVDIHCSPLVQVFDRWFGGQRALTKRLPSRVFDLDERGRRAVIEGLIDSDGSRHVRGSSYRISFATSSEMLGWDVVELLKSVGVAASINQKRGPHTAVIDGRLIKVSESWSITFSGWALYGERSPRQGSGRSSIDTAAGIPVKIKSIEEVPSEEVFDLSVPGVETFVANGLLVHNSAEKWQQGLMARLMNKALRRWASGQTVVEIESESGSKPTLLLINQVRDKIGVMYGDPSTMPGGKGQRFANSLVLRFRSGKKTKLDDTKETVNHLIHVKVDKSKVCPPDENADFVIWLREHQGNIPGTTSEPKIVMESALKEGIIDRDKTGYAFNGTKFTSQKAILALLTEDEMLLDSVRMQIINNMNARRLRHA